MDLLCFFRLQDGMSIGSSLYDEEGAKIVPEILAKAEKLGVHCQHESAMTSADALFGTLLGK